MAGADVNCSGSDDDGFELDPGSLNSLTVETGSSVSALFPVPPALTPPNAVVFVNGIVTTLTNRGTIAGLVGNQAGLDVGGVGVGGFFNSGIISGSGNGPAIFVDGDVLGPFFNSPVGLIFGHSGLFATGNIANTENHGTIEGDLFGIGSNGTINRVSNTGTVFGGTDGVHADDIGTVINDGTIEGFNFEGILAVNSIGRVINRGDIFGGEDGVEATNITSLINFGLIDGLDDGIDVDGGGVNNVATSVIGSIINHGTIRGDDEGIDVGTLTRLVNTGSIIGDFDPNGSGAGIAAAVIGEIINSGLIMTGGDISNQHAIEERGAGDTNLTLNAGSVLIGLIDLGGGTNTLNIGAGRSLNSRFDSDDGIATLPILGTLAGHLVAFDGNDTQRQIVAIDQSAFLSFDEALYALVSGIGQATVTRQQALRSDPSLGFASRFAAASGPQPGAFAAFNDASPFDPNRFWVEAFGSYRQDQSDRTGSDFDHLTGGLVAGVDVPIDPTTSLGVMAGFAGATSENEIDTQETDALSVFAGVYGSTEAIGIAWDGSLTVGYTDYEADRVTANNLVAGGLETANADFGGWFINPQVTATREATNPFAGRIFHGFTAAPTLQQSVSLSYAGLFLNGYTETGTTNPLTLNSRTVHIASARAALTLPFERVEADGVTTTLRLTGGVEAQTQFGDDTVSGTLLGQAVSTTLDDDNFGAGAFLGLSGAYETASGVTAYANAEAMIETDASWQFSATAGLRIAF
jgi:hypothetical protein